MMKRINTIAILIYCVVLLASCSGSKPSSQSEPTSAKPAWFKPDPATAGVISGKIMFTGKAPVAKKIDMDQDPQCVKLHQNAVMDEAIAARGEGKDRVLANVFVYIKQGLEEKNFEPPTEPVTIDQNGCWFSPRVMGVRVGQTFKVTNSDPLTHNIHPLPEINRDWNQSQSPGDQPLTRRFTQPEVMVRVKCNIHSWMHAWVGVVAHPYFAVTGEDGAFQLRDVPPGTYTLEAWQEELGKIEQKIVLAPSAKSDIVFEFKSK